MVAIARGERSHTHYRGASEYNTSILAADLSDTMWRHRNQAEDDNNE